MKDVIVRAHQMRGDGNYSIEYPDGRVLVFRMTDGRVDEGAPAYLEVPEFEAGERVGARREPVRIVLETEQDRFGEYDDYRPENGI